MAIFSFPRLQTHVDELRGIVKPFDYKKCIIIGSSDSLLSGAYGDYIDNENALVVRINRMPLPEFYKHYGTRTDLLISWLNVRNPQCAYYNADLKKFNYIRFEYLKLRPTTGIISLMLLGCIFDEIELFGFGFTNRKYNDPYFHYMDGETYRGRHNMILEDKKINQFQEEYNGKIYRGEERHEELHFDNPCKVEIENNSK